MPRYIDIDKMNRWTEVDQDSCSRENCASTDYDCNECYYNNGGAEDVAPVVHAKWTDFSITNWSYACGICGERVSWQSNYCPNCGAKMEGVV